MSEGCQFTREKLEMRKKSKNVDVLSRLHNWEEGLQKGWAMRVKGDGPQHQAWINLSINQAI